MNVSAVSLLLTAMGAYCIVAAAFDWDFFMEHPKASLFVNVLGRQRARVFYVLFGAAIIVAAFTVPWLRA